LQNANAEKNSRVPHPTRISLGGNPTVVYPEHGTGRAAKLTTCRHCGGKPLIVRKCGRRSCAVCQKCGFHHRTKLK
jgi:hypothetical protein